MPFDLDYECVYRSVCHIQIYFIREKNHVKLPTVLKTRVYILFSSKVSGELCHCFRTVIPSVYKLLRNYDLKHRRVNAACHTFVGLVSI